MSHDVDIGFWSLLLGLFFFGGWRGGVGGLGLEPYVFLRQNCSLGSRMLHKSTGNGLRMYVSKRGAKIVGRAERSGTSGW